MKGHCEGPRVQEKEQPSFAMRKKLVFIETQIKQTNLTCCKKQNKQNITLAKDKLTNQD